MQIDNKHLILSVLVSAVLITILMAASLPNLDFRPGKGGFASIQKDGTELNGTSSPLWMIRHIVRSPRLLLLAITPLLIIYCIRSPRALLRLIILCCVCLGLYLLRDHIPWGKIPFVRKNIPLLAEQAQGLPTIDRLTPTPPWWLVLFSSLGFSTLIFGISVYIWRRLRPQTSTRNLVVREVKKTLADLKQGVDIKEGVLRCYYEMTRVVSQQLGFKRKHSMTAREFESALEEIGLPGDRIRRLTLLFEKVRYGAKNLDTQEENEAVDCLTAIIKDCEETP
ncbi:DUF4129 domain-containing protein [Thermodesulfobacteriota bacterium]